MKAFRFKIPFTKPIAFKTRQHSFREGILIEQGGQWAEASPLPGFSAETIEDVIAALRGEQSPPASLQFALQSLAEPITDEIKVPWNYLLLGDEQQVLEDTEHCVQAKCRAAKLKVGRNDLQSEIELVKVVRERLPDHVKLRLDANQAWSFEQAVTFFQAMQDVDLQYVEEPLKNSRLLEDLHSQTGASYALDETLLHDSCLDPWPNAAALICKPMILGGHDAVLCLKKTGKPIVFSSAFESGVGIARIAQLAASFSPERAAGLDTLDWLSEDLLIDSPQKRGEMFVIPSAPVVDPAKVEAITL